MSTLTPIQQLDEVLNTLVSDISHISLNDYEEIYKRLELKEIFIQKNDLLLILNKLEDEKYISSEERLIVTPGFVRTITVKYYKSTFDGNLFSQQGGYSKLEELKELNISTLQLEKLSQEQQAKAIKSYTKWIVIATVVAGIYYLKELVVWLLHVLPSCF